MQERVEAGHHAEGSRVVGEVVGMGIDAENAQLWVGHGFSSNETAGDTVPNVPTVT